MLGATLAVIWALPSTLVAQSGEVCSSTLLTQTFSALQMVHGDPVESVRAGNGPMPLSQLVAERVTFLGAGAEGMVYRVENSTKGTYLLKSFHPDERDSLREAVQLLNYWGELSANLNTPTAFRIAIPRPGPVEGTLIFDDVRGDSVREILSSKDYSVELKIRFTRKLFRALSQFIDAMTQQYADVRAMQCCLAHEDFRSTFSPYIDIEREFLGLENQTNTDLYLYFSPHNILYDIEKDHFVIIDPV